MKSTEPYSYDLYKVLGPSSAWIIIIADTVDQLLMNRENFKPFGRPMSSRYTKESKKPQKLSKYLAKIWLVEAIMQPWPEWLKGTWQPRWCNMLPDLMLYRSQRLERVILGSIHTGVTAESLHTTRLLHCLCFVQYFFLSVPGCGRWESSIWGRSTIWWCHHARKRRASPRSASHPGRVTHTERRRQGHHSGCASGKHLHQNGWTETPPTAWKNDPSAAEEEAREIENWWQEASLISVPEAQQ